ADAARTDEQLTRDREDHRDGRAEPDSGHEVRQRRREDEEREAAERTEAEDPLRVAGDRVDVGDAVKHLDEDLPKRREDNDDERGLAGDAEQHDRDGDDRDGWDRAK